MSRWTIDRVRQVPPTNDADCDVAYAIHFREDDRPDPQMTVEYASGGTHASQAHARRVVTPYLDDAEPPRRLVVGRDGTAAPR